ncbi:S-adenosyl-L-methionine-dependent methyltransferase [Arachis hypogaea]|nr:S-adenosyl-L-methionine-dependent methyltransferase [Arachis hypogaea]
MHKSSQVGRISPSVHKPLSDPTENADVAPPSAYLASQLPTWHISGMELLKNGDITPLFNSPIAKITPSPAAATSPEPCRTNPHPFSLKPFPFFTPRFFCNLGPLPHKSFDCFHRQNPNIGFNPSFDSSKFTTYKTDLDLPISQLFQIAKSAKSVIWLGLDVGGGTGSFTATMKLCNVTVVTTTMRISAPYSEAMALRGLVPLHVPLQQRLPMFDGVVDLVRCGRAVNRWIPVTMMEFLQFDVDRVLRGGGYLWIDRFFSKGVDLEKLYAPLIGKLGYKKAEAQISVIPDTNLNPENAVSIRNGDLVVSSSISNATTTQKFRTEPRQTFLLGLTEAIGWRDSSVQDL